VRVNFFGGGVDMPESEEIVKVLNIVSAWPRWGGDTITLWLVHQVNELNHAGNRVDVFAPSWKSRRSGVMFNPLWEYWPYSIHRFRYFPARWETLTHEKPASDGASSLWGKAKAACYVLAGCWAAFRLNHREHYDWLHVHWPWPHALFGFAAKLAWPKSKVVWTFYGSEFSQMKGFRWLMRWLVQRVHTVTAISNFTAGLVHDKIGRGIEVKVIPFGAVPRPVANGGRRTSGYTTKRVLFVGRLVERKGVDVLIEASRGQPWTLVIVGQGPEFGRLWTLSQGMANVSFLGAIDDMQLDQEFRDADVFVLPARVDKRGDTEGLGVVLLEAMSYGLPTIASNVGGIGDIPGVYVTPDQPQELRRTIRFLLNSHGIVASIPPQFLWPAIIARWREVYGSYHD